jgi:hypothetical protein
MLTRAVVRLEYANTFAKIESIALVPRGKACRYCLENFPSKSRVMRWAGEVSEVHGLVGGAM